MTTYFYLPQSCPAHDRMAEGFQVEADSAREAADKLPYEDFECEACQSWAYFAIRPRLDPLPDCVRPFSRDAVDWELS